MLKQDHLQQVAQDHGQAAFDYIRRWRLSISGHYVPVFDYLHSNRRGGKKRGVWVFFLFFFLCVQMEFNFCPLPLSVSGQSVKLQTTCVPYLCLTASFMLELFGARQIYSSVCWLFLCVCSGTEYVNTWRGQGERVQNKCSKQMFWAHA